MRRRRRQLRRGPPVEGWLVVVSGPGHDDGAAGADVRRGRVLGVNGPEGHARFGRGREVAAARQLFARVALSDRVALEAVVPHDALHVAVGRNGALVPAEDLGPLHELVAEAVAQSLGHNILFVELHRLGENGCVVGWPIAIRQCPRLVLVIEVAWKLLPHGQDTLLERLTRCEQTVVDDHPHVVVGAAVVLHEDVHPFGS
mmetsp:Transcript_163778/g.525241  ORF Transcript_163778/g.525241 Transcript_163778/m.525241 type:complete len:201 (+) Transcript_163778:648-1250(+)